MLALPLRIPLLLGLLALLPASAQVVTVPITLTLDSPGPAAPGINHLKIDLSGAGSGSDNSRMTGTSQAVLLLDVGNPDAPVPTGIQFTDGDIDLEPISIPLVTAVSSVTVTGSNLGGRGLTLSGHPEPVAAGTFDAAPHVMDINRGTLVAVGTTLFGPVNVTRDFAVEPITRSTSGTGTFTATKRSASAGIAYVYQVKVSLPISFVEPIPAGILTLSATVNGTYAATGETTVLVLPKLRPLAMTPGGFQVELAGNPGSVVLLRASDGFGAWSTVSSVTLTGPTAVVTDPDAIAMPRRYYRLESP